MRKMNRFNVDLLIKITQIEIAAVKFALFENISLCLSIHPLTALTGQRCHIESVRASHRKSFKQPYHFCVIFSVLSL